jgi:hypothetical protein
VEGAKSGSTWMARSGRRDRGEAETPRRRGTTALDFGDGIYILFIYRENYFSSIESLSDSENTTKMLQLQK